MDRGKGQGYGWLQEVDMILYHAKTAERVIVMTFHCIKWSKCISVLFTYYFEGSEFSRNGGWGVRFEVSRALVAPPPANFSRTRTSDPPRRLKDLSLDINQSFFFSEVDGLTVPVSLADLFVSFFSYHSSFGILVQICSMNSTSQTN